jgi:hypothetical protein
LACYYNIVLIKFSKSKTRVRREKKNESANGVKRFDFGTYGKRGTNWFPGILRGKDWCFVVAFDFDGLYTTLLVCCTKGMRVSQNRMIYKKIFLPRGIKKYVIKENINFI